MHGQRIDLRVREAVAAALPDIVQNKGDAVVEVFMLFGTGAREKRIRACTQLQIFPDRIPEMFARFCHNGAGFSQGIKSREEQSPLLPVSTGL